MTLQALTPLGCPDFCGPEQTHHAADCPHAAPPAASPAGGPALTEEYARNDVWATARVGTIAEFHAALDAYRAAVAAHHRAEGERWKERYEDAVNGAEGAEVALRSLRDDFDWLEAEHRRICGRLQDLAQKYRLGLGGESLDEIVVEAYEVERARAERAEAALREARSILWMAEAYAEGGGSHGPEMQDYQDVRDAINGVLGPPGGGNVPGGPE